MRRLSPIPALVAHSIGDTVQHAQHSWRIEKLYEPGRAMLVRGGGNAFQIVAVDFVEIGSQTSEIRD